MSVQRSRSPEARSTATSIGASTPESRMVHVDVAVSDGFVLLEFAAIVDALRIANRVAIAPAFTWTFRSGKGGGASSSSRASVETQPFPERPAADYLFVVGNSDPNAPSLSMGPILKRYTYAGAQVFLLAEAASRYIEVLGAEGRGLSTHWENAEALRERTLTAAPGTHLASRHGSIVTCAGMETTLDVVLAVIGRHISSTDLMTLADILLHERIRNFDTNQLSFGFKNTAPIDEHLSRAIALMHANVEEPLKLGELVDRLQISGRTLQRKFWVHLGTSPRNYYQKLRLARAKNLLLNTVMPVGEVGLACGFPHGFSVTYKRCFGMTPNEVRRRALSGGAG